MKISAAHVDDAKQILDLQKLAYQQEAVIYNDFAIPPLVQTHDEIIDQFSNVEFLKAVKKDKIIGSVRAYCDETTCYIGRLIVHPDYQGKGIGTKLMSAIEQQFKNSERVELFTGTKSEKNIRFYENLGYQRFKQEKIHQGLSLVYFEKLRNAIQ